MISTREELAIVAQKARRWRDHLRAAPVVKLSAGERADLAHTLDELQHVAVHGFVGHPTPRGA